MFGSSGFFHRNRPKEESRRQQTQRKRLENPQGINFQKLGRMFNYFMLWEKVWDSFTLSCKGQRRFRWHVGSSYHDVLAPDAFSSTSSSSHTSHRSFETDALATLQNIAPQRHLLPPSHLMPLFPTSVDAKSIALASRYQDKFYKRDLTMRKSMF